MQQKTENLSALFYNRCQEFINCFLQYILLTIVMNSASNQTSPHDFTLFTKDEITENGCCFSLLAKLKPGARQTDILTIRNFSEPKQKKIDLVIAKRGHTQEKDLRIVLKQSLKAKPTYIAELKQLDTVPGNSNQSSNLTTQKNSLKNSRKKLQPQSKNTKLTITNRLEKYIDINNQGIKKLEVIAANQTKAENSNIQLLSQISFVEEEFISHESTTLRALNILQSQEKQREQVVTPVRYMLESPLERQCNTISDAPNPLQRLLQKKRGYKPESNKQRLVL